MTSIESRAHLLPTLPQQTQDQLEPYLIGPEFPQAMWAPLRDQSPEWIVPGLSEIENDSLGLLVPNQRFIEAYMVGLNHEMVRELQWNEYPFDQRATMFRQFWETRGYVKGPKRSDGSGGAQGELPRHQADPHLAPDRVARRQLPAPARALGLAGAARARRADSPLPERGRLRRKRVPADADRREVPRLLGTARSGRGVLRLRAVRLGRPRSTPAWYFVLPGAARRAAVPRARRAFTASPGTYLTPEHSAPASRPPRTSPSRRCATRSASSFRPPAWCRPRREEIAHARHRPPSAVRTARAALAAAA